MWLYQRLTMFWNGTNVTKLSVIQSRDDDCVDWSQRPNAGEGRGLPATGLTWPADAGAGRFCVHGFPFLFIVITWPEMYYVIFIGRIDFERDTFFGQQYNAGGGGKRPGVVSDDETQVEICLNIASWKLVKARNWNSQGARRELTLYQND